jgi:hypothetical protein
MGQDDAIVIQLDAEQTTGKLFQNSAGNFDAIFFAHIPFGADRPGNEPAREND